MEKQKKGSIIGIVIALVCCCVFSMSSIAFAATDESTITDGGVGVSAVPPAPIQQDGGISVRGKNPPTTDNVQNVGKKDYYFSVDHVGAQVYTSKWLTGKNRFWVEVNHHALT